MTNANRRRQRDNEKSAKLTVNNRYAWFNKEINDGLLRIAELGPSQLGTGRRKTCACSLLFTFTLKYQDCNILLTV
jgi:hypothetical protein